MNAPQQLTHAEWQEEARRRFGPAIGGWKFVCPCCGHVASAEDWRKAGAPLNAIGFSCIGRYLPGKPRSAFYENGAGPCDYTSGGLFNVSPIVVTIDGVGVAAFAFAPEAKGGAL